jgi:hypothetical protein
MEWSASSEAIPYAELMNPQSLNLYGFVNNKPLNKTDASGHQSVMPLPIYPVPATMYPLCSTSRPSTPHFPKPAEAKSPAPIPPVSPARFDRTEIDPPPQKSEATKPRQSAVALLPVTAWMGIGNTILG